MSEDLEILINPDQEYWKKAADQVVNKEGWVNSYEEYPAWVNEFGDDFKLLVAVKKDSREFVGCVSVTRFHGITTVEKDVSMIGMFIVMPEFRGKNFGVYLFDEALKRCAERKFLFGAATMTKKYETKYGFDKLLEWRSIKRRVKINNVRPLLLNHDPTLQYDSPQKFGWNEVTKYLQKYIPTVDVTPAIKAIMAQKSAKTIVVYTTENKIVGFGIIRKNVGDVLSVGPVIGNDAIAASTVLRQLLLNLDDLYENKEFIMFSPSVNDEAEEMIRQLSEGHYESFYESGTQPQFTGDIIKMPVLHVYALGQSDISLL